MFSTLLHPFGLSLLATAALYLFTLLVVLLFGGAVRYIPNDRVGIVEKLWSARGSVASGFVALEGEAGFQPHVLRGGWHYFTPFQYRVRQMPLVTIPQGRIGYVFARDGRPLPPTQVLAGGGRARETGGGPWNFEDAVSFLRNGGQRGPQRQILREGTWAINLAQFCVFTENGPLYLAMDGGEAELVKQMTRLIAERQGFSPIVIKGTDDLVGIVTVHDGATLPQGEIIAPPVGDDPREPGTYHNSFQDPERFLEGGGRRGRQLQVLVEGTYNINRLFATVELVPKTIVEVGHVGVVVSYTGGTSEDVSGSEYKHGELVPGGSRGVWSTPLLPGKYAFNTFAGKVVMVPTTNFILKWIKSETGGHHYDENLAEVALITKDAFEPSLPLSVVLHIDYRKAPLVVQRFGDIKRLVEQTLDPMVSAYFKNVAQTRTLIQLLQDRAALQDIAGQQMKEKFAHYNLELEEVLIGTPGSAHGDRAIEQILDQLRARQIAEEQVETYVRKEKAAVKERELREAEARAKQQTAMTESEIAITVESNRGRADYQRSVQKAAEIQALAEAEGKKVLLLADAEAGRIRVMGEAEAGRTAQVGLAQAIAVDEQVRAYGGPRFQVTQAVLSRLSEAIEKSGVDIVPKIVIGGGAGASGLGENGSLFQALLALLLSDRMEGGGEASHAKRSPEAEALLAKVRSTLHNKAA